jgi:hypothetical protein
MLKITIDTTPIMAKPSGVGFYVIKLLEGLTELARSDDTFQLNPIYQISLKSALRGNFAAPAPLLDYPRLRYFPLPVKLTNLFAIRSCFYH